MLAEVVKAIWAALPPTHPPCDDAAWQTAPTACTAGAAALCGDWRGGEERDEAERRAN